MKILKILGAAGLLLTAGCASADDEKAEKVKADDAKAEELKTEKEEASDDKAVAVKEKAPDFELVNQEGKKVKLSDYSDKNIVLVFSRAHW